MAQKLYEESNIQAIADAIRSKNGETITYKPSEMATAIEAIPNGGGNTDKEWIYGTITSVSDADFTAINAYQFYNFVHLTKVDFPAVTEIGTYGLWSCVNLESVNLPTLESIKNYGFNGGKFTELYLPSLITVSRAGLMSFSSLEYANLPVCTTATSSFLGYCDKLKKVDLGAITALGSNAFCYDTKLEAVIIRSDVVPTLSNAISAINIGNQNYATEGYFYVPKTLIEEYKTATNWAVFADYYRAIEDYPDICGGV